MRNSLLERASVRSLGWYPMRIGIAFFGLPRNSDRTFASLEEQILAPAARFGEFFPCYHFYEQTEVINPRSGENGALNPRQYLPFRAFDGVLESPAGVPEAWGLTEIAAHGDAWGDDCRSLRNLLLQLHSLRMVTLRLQAAEPDLVLFVRPDLHYHQSFEPALRAMSARLAPRTVWLPFWQWAGGYNDRFAICGRDAFMAYGTRILKIQEYLSAHPGRPLHAERFLRFALDREMIAVRRLDISASRVRVNGDEVSEDFSSVQLNRLVRWGGREVLKWLCRHGA